MKIKPVWVTSIAKTVRMHVRFLTNDPGTLD